MRKLKHLLLAATAVFFLSIPVFSQQITLKGTVTSEKDNSPVPGVSVKIKGKGGGTQTDSRGDFTIQANKGDVLEISSIGYRAVEITVSNNPKINIRLQSTEKVLEEVVVAMDIRRNPRELGYSVQKIQGQEIAQTQRENFLNSLQGRVAGLTITPTGGQAGASANIVLRGFNSLALSNQPLFIVDGIIVDNQSLNENSNSGSGLGLASDRSNRGGDYLNRIADLNPTDIESITVLKGPEATALYGSQASAGALVITTKRGRGDGKLHVSYDNSFRFQRITRFPDVQTTYGPGTSGTPDNVFSYFGPKYPAGTKFYDNIRSFFKTGFAQTHNIAADWGNAVTAFRFSGSFLNESGVVPTNTYRKINLRLSNTTKLGKYGDITPSISYINSNNDKPFRGGNGNVNASTGGYLISLLSWPSTNDIHNYLDQTGNKITVFPTGDPNSEIDNPLFNVKMNRANDKLERVIATLGINIKPTSWLTLSGRFGYDRYNQNGYNFFHPKSNYYPSAVGGYLDNYYRKYYGYNHTINATARKTFGDFTGRAMVGTMWQDYKTDQWAVSGGKIIDVNRTDSNNTDPASRIRLSRQGLYGLPNYILQRQIAYFGEVALSYKDFIFVDYTHRFEESSTLPKINRKFNYPGGSVSIIFTDMIPGLKDNRFLNYGKLRGSMASTARSNSPYSNQSVFTVANSSGGGFTYDFTNNNFFLTPEKQRTFEMGTELRFLNNFLSLDVTYYNTLNKDQIVELFRASYGTGFILNTLNAASTRNQGVEAVININTIRKRDLQLYTTLNFNRAWNKVLSLPANVPEFYNSDTWLFDNARNGLVKGGPTTSITAWGYSRNNKGDILINPNTGLPIPDNTFLVRGDRNPDFTLGINNNLRYKNWTFNMLWDLKVGGDIFNGTELYLARIGRSTRTLDRETPRIIYGVLKDGNENSANPTKNTIIVNPYYNSTNYYGALQPEFFIEKHINWLRLRDLTISYSFKKDQLFRWNYLKGLSAFVTGNDLILWTNYGGVDPAVNGTTPATKGVGGFAFDYGNTATPIGLNIGFRADF